ncbi:MAG: class I SAM-dependent methyltransferase [Chloroflexi bacterium]|nr:class I SAM-dependent methyltransferase [Chloroflexota bacterium]
MLLKREYYCGLATSALRRLRRRDYGFIAKQMVTWGQNRVRNQLARRRNRLEGGLAIPPSELIYLVAGTDDVSWFLQSGAAAAQSITEVLNKHDLEINRFGSILDFGCGVGRVMRWWSGLQETRLCGTDYNAALVAWCQKNLAFAQFQVNGLVGPLAYSDASFNFIYALSVFTHLTEPQQLFWIEELGRLLHPNGLLLITTHGEHYLAQLRPDDQRRFRQGDLIVYEEEKAGSNRCVAFHPPVYVREKLAPNLVLIDFAAEGARGNPWQDVYLLTKPPF